jgi:hypothetical protein
MKKILVGLAVLLLAALVATPAEGASPQVAAYKTQLVSAIDFQTGCRTLDGPVKVPVDYVFQYKATKSSGWVTVWVSDDGVQFTLIRDAQNPPWGCVPLVAPIAVPSAWAKA